MKRSLFLVLILRAVFTFANGDLENSLTTVPPPVNCSSALNGAICHCDYASLRLSCRNVTHAVHVPPAIWHLSSVTRTHYWNELTVSCDSVDESSWNLHIFHQLSIGDVKFASVTLVGNCSRYSEDTDNDAPIDDYEIRKLSIRENTLFLNCNEYGNEIYCEKYGGKFRPIQGLKSLSELTVSKSLFNDNTIKGQFSDICQDNCTYDAHGSIVPQAHPLVKLTITSCNISTVEVHAFRNFADLELIDLSYNQISELFRASFASTLTSLRILKLEHNQLTSLEAGFFDGLPQLREINLSYNRMMTLPSLTPNSKLIQVLHLGENPWLCRCPMTWILRAPGFAGILADEPICAWPDYVQNKPLIEGLTVVNSTFC